MLDLGALFPFTWQVVTEATLGPSQLQIATNLASAIRLWIAVSTNSQLFSPPHNQLSLFLRWNLICIVTVPPLATSPLKRNWHAFNKLLTNPLRRLWLLNMLCERTGLALWWVNTTTRSLQTRVVFLFQSIQANHQLLLHVIASGLKDKAWSCCTGPGDNRRVSGRRNTRRLELSVRYHTTTATFTRLPSFVRTITISHIIVVGRAHFLFFIFFVVLVIRISKIELESNERNKEKP